MMKVDRITIQNGLWSAECATCGHEGHAHTRNPLNDKAAECHVLHCTCRKLKPILINGKIKKHSRYSK